MIFDDLCLEEQNDCDVQKVQRELLNLVQYPQILGLRLYQKNENVNLNQSMVFGLHECIIIWTNLHS